MVPTRFWVITPEPRSHHPCAPNHQLDKAALSSQGHEPCCMEGRYINHSTAYERDGDWPMIIIKRARRLGHWENGSFAGQWI